MLCAALAEAGFGFRVPDGAYYVLCDTSGVDPDRDSSAFARQLVVDPGVAAVPGTSFYRDPHDGAGLLRFAFPKRLPTLQEAGRRLSALA